MVKNKEFYSTWEVAERLKVNPTTVFRAIRSGRLKASKTPGGHYRISRDDLERYLKDHDVPSGDVPPRVRRVLIVEDNAAELRLYQRAFSECENLLVKGTSSGYQAGFLTKSFMPDLLILDIYLNEGDGRDIARLVRGDEALKDIQIMVVTGSRDLKTHEEIRAVGINDIVFKPVSPEDLRKRALRLLAA